MEHLKHIIELSKEFLFAYLLTKRSLYVSLFAFATASIYLSTLTPKFLIQSEIILEEQKGGASGAQGGITSLLSNYSPNKRPYDKFKTNAYSLSNAKQLWDQGFAKKYYSHLYDSDSDSFKNKPVTFLEKFSSFILGYEINSEFTVNDFHDFIKSNVNIIIDDQNTSLVVRMVNSDPESSKLFVHRFILGADQVAKNNTIATGRSRIERLTAEIQNKQHPKIIYDGLVSLINQKLFEVTSAEASAPLSIIFIEEPRVSNNPSFPNTSATIFSFIVMFLFINYLIIFFRRNF